MAGRTYSFLLVQATIAGPGGSFNMGNGASVSEEGITIEPNADKDIQTIGADGGGMHSLVADKSATIIVRLLKVSPVNAQLMTMYDLQSLDPALWGNNVIAITDNGSSDSTGARGVAFKRKPTVTYAKAGQMVEWQFSAIECDTLFGTY